MNKKNTERWMLMKVFISHKKEDEERALTVKSVLDKKGVSSYLDLLDNSVVVDGKALTDHIKSNLNSCTDVIVVMTDSTQKSWWVPFEIGMSAQKDMPTASFLAPNVELPDYLNYWPRLKNLEDIETYVDVRKSFENKLLENRRLFDNAYSQTKIDTHAFYQELKRKLR